MTRYLKNALRKLILCALGMSDEAKAREVFLQMSPSHRKDPSTMYLLYKVAMRSHDSELGYYVIALLVMNGVDDDSCRMH